MGQVKGHAGVVGALLDHGADVNRMNDDGLTALNATVVLLLGDVPPGGHPKPSPTGHSMYVY